MRKPDFSQRYGGVLRAVSNFLVFFLLIAFLITCCVMLFVSVTMNTMNIELTADDIGPAAKWTFANVLLLSLVFSVVDAFRRRHMIDRPVRRIVEAAEKIAAGDFSVRVPKINAHERANGFDIITDCFNRMAEELSGTETLRTDFVANVSHELKTPLTVIKNYGTLLSQPGLDEAKRIEYAQAVARTAQKLADLVSNILRLNKLENQQIFPEPKLCDLGEQLSDVLLSFEQRWEEKSLTLEVDIAEDVRVRTDAEMLSLVWANLISNAIKFTPDGGTLSVSLHAEGENAVVRVSDTGCGISSDVGAHIFDKFYQGDRSRASEGNGLGLALVKRVIDIVGGEISVESEIGRGSTFSVKLRRVSDGAD